MGIVDLAAARARRQRRLSQRVALVVERAWAQIDADDIEGSWERAALPRLVGSVAVAQSLAARDAAVYVDEAVREQGARSAQLSVVPAEVFSGVAADGRSLESLLFQPVIGTRMRLAQGATTDEALAYGQRQAKLFAVNETQATARLADAFAIALDERATGYVRQVNLPSCGRCIVLAGKTFKRNAGFDRHPRCDCVHLPTVGSGSFGTQSPESVFKRLPPDEQDAAFGKANAAAIRAGGDVSQVVNARRGMSAPGDGFTTEGTTKRGVAGRVLAEKARTRARAAGELNESGFRTRSRAAGERYAVAKQRRMTPAALLSQYGDEPERFAAALRANGYLA